MNYALDLTKNHAERRFGDITVFLTWFKNRGQPAPVPALVLMPTAAIGREGVVPCVVPITSAWAWAEETGDGGHCARMSAKFAALLGLNAHNINTVMRVTSIIRECMHDLLTIPPRPTSDRVVVADAIKTDQDGKQTHSEIMGDAT